MAIAIKHLESSDISAFENFLKTERRELPELRLASLVYPHEDIAVAAFKKDVRLPKRFAEKHRFVLREHGCSIISLSKHEPRKLSDNSEYIFSGYVFHNGKMLIGETELSDNIKGIQDISENYGEFCAAVIGNDSISLSSDFFGMVPWFYFDNDEIFAASNNYHMLLLLLSEMGVKLTMNIPRSRVNIITSGYTYGSPFSTDLDVNGCKVNLAYDKISYSSVCGVVVNRSSLWDILTSNEEWNDDQYEEYIFKAKQEIEQNIRAAFECPRFDKIVVDVSGGFDSRIVFAAACDLPKQLRKKMYTHTRKSGTPDDIEKASAVTNLYNYPKYSYPKNEVAELFDYSGAINLEHVSRTLGAYAVESYLYTAHYDDYKTLELTGGLGDECFGYQRIRGELDYNDLGDKRLLARLGGCYLHNSVDELQGVFQDQEKIIFNTLDNYSSCDCLFKKFHQLYVDFRNRFHFGSAHNVENNNFRIPMAFSKYALMAKWTYFNKFGNNQIPNEKISIDLLTAINPLLALLPFAQNNDNVIPKPENLLNSAKLDIKPDSTFIPGLKTENIENSYREKVNEYMDDPEIAEQMLLHIYDYSKEYYPVCLGLYKVLSLMKADLTEIKSRHGRETIRKIYDVYYQMRIAEGSQGGN